MNLPSAARQQRIEFLAAAVLTVLLIGLHVVVLLSAGPLWRDEISSLTLATKPTWSELWATLRFDPFPAFFFSLLRAWHAAFGASDFALRLLGFCIGLAGIAAFWSSARLTGRRAPLLALALLGLSPTLVIWGDSLRAYGVGVFWIALAFGCFWRVTVNPGRREIALALLTSVLSVQSIFTNAVLILACGLAAAAVAIRRRQWRTAAIVLGIGAIAGLSLLPYVKVIGSANDWAEVRKARLPLSAYFDVMWQALATGGAVMQWAWLLLALGGVLAALFSQRRSSVASDENPDADASLYALLAGLLSLAATMAFFRFLSWPTNIWYYLPLCTVAALAIDLAMRNARWVYGSVVRVAVAALVVIGSAAVVLERVQVRASNLDIVAQLIATRAAPDDLVVIYPFVDGITFRRYFHGTQQWTTVPEMQDLSLHRWDQLMEQLRRPHAIAPVLARIDETLRSGHSVWLASTFPLNAPAGGPPEVLPLSESNQRRIGYFLSGWGSQLAAALHEHAEKMYALELPADQQISRYEHSRVLMFSGWREHAAVSQ